MLNRALKLSEKLFTKDLEKKEIRDGCGEGLVLAGEADQNVVVLTADLADSTRASYFRDKFPDRFFEVGVAEQSLILTASGLANYGKVPFVTSFSIFSTGRAWEMIRTAICLNNVPVKIIGSHGGFSAGLDGANHQATEDIALMRSLPNMVVEVPCDAVEAKKAILAAVKSSQPVFIRTQKQPTAVITTEKTPYTPATAEIFWQAKDPQVVIVACGPTVYSALKAARELQKTGLESVVVNCHTVKPMDKQTLIHLAKIAGAVVTVEEHQITGGLGSAVAEVLSQNFPVPVEFVGIQDIFAESAAYGQLVEKYHLAATDIISAAKAAINKKGY